MEQNKREADANYSVKRAVRALHTLELQIQQTQELLDQIVTTGTGAIAQGDWTLISDITAEVVLLLKDAEREIRRQRASNLLKVIRGY